MSSVSLSLHRAFCRVTWLAHQPMHTLKLFTLKLLEMLWHVSIIRSSSGSCLFLAKITLLKTFNAILARNRQLPDDDRMIETRRSIFKSFNVNNLSVCIGWCADQVTLRSARCNDKDELGWAWCRREDNRKKGHEEGSGCFIWLRIICSGGFLSTR